MKDELGDIDLFNTAIASNRVDPPVDDYLRSTGLTEAQVREVRSLFKVFCEAIENATTSELPDVATGLKQGIRTSPSAVN